jgi:hypothetical protein
MMDNARNTIWDQIKHDVNPFGNTDATMIVLGERNELEEPGTCEFVAFVVSKILL